MDPQRPTTADINQPHQVSSDALESVSPEQSIDQNGNWVNNSSLEAADTVKVHGQNESVPAQALPIHSLSRTAVLFGRKSTIVSVIITVTVTLLTGVTILMIIRQANKSQANNLATKQQDVSLKDAAISNLPSELQGTAKSLFVNGDIITRGVLKVSNGSFSTIIKADPTANQTFNLPGNSGTICVDSNNCGYASLAQFQGIQNQFGQTVSSVNGQSGVVNLTGFSGVVVEGTTISNSGVLSVGGQTGALSLGLGLNNNGGSLVNSGVLSVGGQTGALSLGLGLNNNGGSLVNSGVVSITSPNSSININNAGNGVYELTVGATAGSVALGPASAQADPSNNSSININKTGSGNLIQLSVGGVNKFLVTDTGALSLGTPLTVANGGTGVGTAPANGQLLIGNGTTGGYNLANITSGSVGIEIVNGAGSIRIDAPGLGECDICANNNLNNLNNTLINVDLKPGTAGGVSLGTAASPFSALRISGASLDPTNNSFLITGSSTNGVRTITLPDSSGTVCINTNNCGYVNLQTSSPGSTQVGNINVDGIIIAGTRLQASLLKTADSTSSTTAAIAVRSGDATAGNNSSGDVTIDAGAKSGSGVGGSLVVAGTNAGGLTLGRAGLNVLAPGTLNGQTVSASSNFTGTVTVQGANALTLGSGANVGAIRFNTNGTNFITLQSPATGNFSLILPSALPASTSCLNLTNAGIIGTQGCASGLGGSGTENTIALFGAGGTSVANSLLVQSGTAINLLGTTNNATLAVGTSATIGVNGATNPVTGLLILNDGSNPGRTLTLRAQQAGNSYTLQLPADSAVGSSCLILENVSAGVNRIAGSTCAAGGGGGGNITASGGSTNNKLVRFTNNGAAYTAVASLLNDNGVTVGINTPPQTELFTVGSANAFKVTDAGAISASASIASSGLIQTTAGTQALTLSGAPAPGTGVTSLLQLGNAIVGGNTTLNGGTYLGLNAPLSGAGSAADFINFQLDGVSKLKATNAGDLTAGKLNGVTLATTGSDFSAGDGTRTLTVSANSTINQNLSSSAGVNFGSLGLTTALGIGSGGTGLPTTPSNGQLLIGNGTGYNLTTLTQGSGITITNGSGTITIAASGGGGSCASCATRELNNLQNVAINTHLTAGAIGASAGIDLGSSTTPFRELYLSGTDTSGADLFKFTGDATQDRTITIPDLDGTIALVRSSATSAQAGSINIDGTLTSGTSVQTPLLQTADSSTAATANLAIRSGNATGGSFNSGNLSLDVGSATATAGTITLGSANATALTLGRTGLATTIAGGLNFTNTSPQTINVITQGALNNNIGTSLTVSAGNAGSQDIGNGGGALNLSGGNAAGTGNNNGGDVILSGGTLTGTGSRGNVILQSSGGKVGIGISDPSTALDLVGAVTIRASTAPSNAPIDQGRFYYDAITDKLNLSLNGGAYSNVCTVAACTGAGASVDLQAAYNTPINGNNPEIKVDVTRGAVTIQDANTSLGASVDIFSVTGSAPTGFGTTLFNVQGSGNVGIGINTPTAKLHVVSTNGIDGTVGTAGTAGLTVVGGNGGNSSADSTSGGAAGNILQTAGNGGNATGLTSSGGVGGTIALTAGNAGNSTGTAGVAGGGVSLIAGNGGNTTGAFNNANGGDISLQGGAAGTGGTGSAGNIGNLLLAGTGGNVGIRTADPTSNLQVTGGTISSGSVTMTASNGATTFTTSSTIKLNPGDYIVPVTATDQARAVTVGGTGTSFTITPAFSSAVSAQTFTVHKGIFNFTTTTGDSALFGQGSTSNIGIGTANPLAKLHVLGVQPAAAATGVNATLALQVTGGQGGNANGSGTSAGAGAGINLASGGGGNGVGSNTSGGNGGDINLQTGVGGTATGTGTAGAYGNVILQSSGGNVGIGLVSPTARLAVSDSATGISSGSVTMTYVSGNTTFTTSGTLTLGVGDYIIPTTTSQARAVTATATGTSFTVSTPFTSGATQTFTIYRPIVRLATSSGNNAVVTQGNTGNVRFYGSARNERKVTLAPEFVGAVLNGDGTSNIGTMTADFCAKTAGSIPDTNTSVCTAAGDKHNYYTWTASQTTQQDYDMYLRWQVPSDFDGFTGNRVSAYGWVDNLSGANGNKVQLTIFNQSGAVCGDANKDLATTASVWILTPITNMSADNDCAPGGTGINPGDVITFKIHLSIEDSDLVTGGFQTPNTFSRIGEITIDYLSKF